MRSEHIQHIAVWYSSSPTIAGVKLRQLTLGHWRILEAMGSPFAGSTLKQPTRDDVCVALCICTLSFKWAYFVSRHPYLLAIIALWRARRATELDAVALSAYFTESWYKPEVYVDTAHQPRTQRAYAPCCGAAIRLAMSAERAGVMRLLHRNVRSIWDVSVAEALWVLSCSEEISGAELESVEEVQDGDS